MKFWIYSLCLALLLCPKVLASDLSSQQAVLSQDIALELSQEDYSLENPFVLLNPFGFAPLTALIAFQTPEAGQVTLILEGDSPETTLTRTFPSSTTWHVIPVVGLYPGRENQVQILLSQASGPLFETTLTLATDPLPEELAVQPPRFSPENTWVFSQDGPLAAYDSQGQVRWYLSPEQAPQPWTLLQDGTLIYSNFAQEGTLSALNLMGQLLATYQMEGEHLSLAPLAEGGLLLEAQNLNFAPGEEEEEGETPEFTAEMALFLRLNLTDGAIRWIWKDLPEGEEALELETTQPFPLSQLPDSYLSLGTVAPTLGDDSPIQWTTPQIPDPAPAAPLHGGELDLSLEKSYSWVAITLGLAAFSFLAYRKN